MYNFNVLNFIGIYPEIFLMIGILSLITYLVILDSLTKFNLILVRLSGFLTILILVFTLILLWNSSYSDFLVFNFLVIQDYYSICIKSILVLSTISLILISWNYFKSEKIVNYEYFILLLLSVLGMFSIVSSYDLITMYLAIELQSLSFYILAAFKRFSNFSTEAGIKYFILGAFSSGLLLFGCSLIYGFTGITNFYYLEAFFAYNTEILNIDSGLFLGIMFIAVGIFFKLGVAPFHMWVPDVYEGVPTPITALFAIVPKLAMIGLLVRLTISMYSINQEFWVQLLIICAFLSLFIGTFGALYQIKLKRMLAYSAIANMGYVLIALASNSIEGMYALTFFFVIYIILLINVFTLILSLRRWNNNLELKRIDEFVLLFKSNPLIAIYFCLALFSLAGIPPLLGFYMKFFVFVAAIKSYLYFAVVFAAVISVISAMYYIRIIKLMFFKVFDSWLFLTKISKVQALILSYSLLLNVLFIIYPSLFITWIQNLVLYLYF